MIKLTRPTTPPRRNCRLPPVSDLRRLHRRAGRLPPGLFQRVDPLLVALTAFALCSLVFLPVALARHPGGVAALLRRPAPLFWINATTGFAWLSFFFALKTIEPALVQVLFYGVGRCRSAGSTGSYPARSARRWDAGSGCYTSA